VGRLLGADGVLIYRIEGLGLRDRIVASLHDEGNLIMISSKIVRVEDGEVLFHDVVTVPVQSQTVSLLPSQSENQDAFDRTIYSDDPRSSAHVSLSRYFLLRSHHAHFLKRSMRRGMHSNSRTCNESAAERTSFREYLYGAISKDRQGDRRDLPPTVLVSAPVATSLHVLVQPWFPPSTRPDVTLETVDAVRHLVQ
jgi:hypothetical protein